MPYTPDWRPLAYLPSGKGWSMDQAEKHKCRKPKTGKARRPKRNPHQLFTPKARLKFLIRKAKVGAWVSRQVYEAARRWFDENYPKLRPGAKCFVCGKRAIHRHHIRLLSRGGTNKRKNVVGLCESCHQEIHPWMDVQPSQTDRLALEHMRVCATG